MDRNQQDRYGTESRSKNRKLRVDRWISLQNLWVVWETRIRHARSELLDVPTEARELGRGLCFVSTCCSVRLYQEY